MSVANTLVWVFSEVIIAIREIRAKEKSFEDSAEGRWLILSFFRKLRKP